MATLNSAVGNIPTDGPVIIVTASFEGQLSTSTFENHQLKTLQGNRLTMRVTLSTGSKISKQMSSQGFGMGYLDVAITIGFIRSSVFPNFVIICWRQEAGFDSCLAVWAMPVKGPFSRCSQSLS
jgi:hypothetical protein